MTAANELLASVIVRSYRRPAALLELVERLLAQSYVAFELLIVEQSEAPALCQTLTDRDPRIRVIARPPLGAPGARNEGIRHARGAVLVFIDDDDEPLGDDWLLQHMRNYADPACVGVNGRFADNARGAGPAYPQLIRALSFRLGLLRDTRTLATGSLRKTGIPYLLGSNVSLRRTLIDAVGGWDEGINMGEEMSFYFRRLERNVPGYLVYDPAPTIWRRLDVAGGLDRREGEDAPLNELTERSIYYHHVVRHYFPLRYWLLWPLFLARPLERACLWLWTTPRVAASPSERLRQTGRLLAAAPHIAWAKGPLAAVPIRRMPRL